MSEPKLIYVLADGAWVDMLETTAHGVNDGNRVLRFGDEGALAAALERETPALFIVDGTGGGTGRLPALLRRFAESPRLATLPVAIVADHPYPLEVKLATSYTQVTSLLRRPPDSNELYLLIKSLPDGAASDAGGATAASAPAFPPKEVIDKFLHDVNNLLGHIVSGLSMFDDDEYPDDVRGIAGRAAKSADALTLYLKRFAQILAPLSTRSAPADLGALVGQAAGRVAEAAQAPAIAVERAGTAREYPVVAADFTALAEELLRNAAEAALERKEAGRASARLDYGGPGAGPRLSVEDNGGGFDAGRLDHELYFTTKNKTWHKGIGLLLARRAAARLGATLRFESAPGGTRAILELPDRA